MKFNKSIIIILCLIIAIILFYNVNFPCLFVTLLDINCPGCGMSRAIDSLMKFNVLKALQYNLLSVPLVIAVIISIVLLIKDIVKKEDTYFNLLIKILDKYKWLIIIIIILNMIINNLK